MSRFQQTVSPQHQGIKLDDFLATYTTESRNGYNARVVLEKTIDGLEREKSELGAKENSSPTGAVRLLLQAEKGEKESVSRAVEFRLTYCEFSFLLFFLSLVFDTDLKPTLNTSRLRCLLDAFVRHQECNLNSVGPRPFDGTTARFLSCPPSRLMKRLLLCRSTTGRS